MKKKNDRRLTRFILMELACLVVVSLVVVSLIRWSEGKAMENEGNAAAGNRVTVTAAPYNAGQGGGTQFSNNGGEKTTSAPGGDDLTATAAPTAGADPAGSPSASDPTGVPASADEPTKVPAAEPSTTAAPSQEAEPTRVPTATAAPTAEPTKASAAEPTKAPTAEPTKAPTATPAATPTVKPSVSSKPGMDMDFINSLSGTQSGETLSDSLNTVYYLQTDSRWGSKIYGGEDTIAKYACGPTSMAIVVSTLTDIGIDPVQMSKWAYDNGYWATKSGSAHSIVNGTAKAFGLESEGIGNDSGTAGKVKEALQNGDMVVALMGPGHFTKGGHFIVLRGITAEGKILVADCNSRDNTLTEWDLDTIQSEVKWAADGGPFWIIRNPNIMQ